MSEINLFDKAKCAAGHLCFDPSVDSKTCIKQTQRLVGEIEKMIAAIEGSSQSAENKKAKA